MLRQCAVGGVDGAVPYLIVLREPGGGEQGTIVHAAQRPDPFAHTLDAQVDTDQRQRALKTGIGRGGGQFLGRRGGCPRRHFDAAAEFLVGEVAVEIRLAADLLVQRARLLGPAGGGQRTRLPVDPVGLRGQRRRHRRNCPLDRVPVMRTQRGAHAPGHLLLGQGGGGGFLVPGHGFRQVALRRLPGDLAPGIGAFFLGETGFDAAEPLRRILRVGPCQALHGEQRRLAPAALRGKTRRQLVQMPRRQLRDRLEAASVEAFAGRQVGGRIARRTDPLGLEKAPHALPDLFHREAAGRHQLVDQPLAGPRQVLAAVPQGAHHVVHVGKLRRVAANFNVGLDQGRQFALKPVPVAGLAQLAQPVAAQFLREIAAGVAVQVIRHPARVAVIEAQAQGPVLGPGLQRMPLQRVELAPEAHPFAVAKGIARQQEGRVAALDRCRRGGGQHRCGGHGRQKRHDRRKNPQQGGGGFTLIVHSRVCRRSCSIPL